MGIQCASTGASEQCPGHLRRDLRGGTLTVNTLAGTLAALATRYHAVWRDDLQRQLLGNQPACVARRVGIGTLPICL